MKNELFNRGKEEWKCKKWDSVGITSRGTSKGRARFGKTDGIARYDTDNRRRRKESQGKPSHMAEIRKKSTFVLGESAIPYYQYLLHLVANIFRTHALIAV